MQIKNDGQIQPTFLRPDVADVARLFLIGCIRMEVPIQQVRGDIEAVAAVRGRLELLVSFYRNSVQSHQSANATMPDIKPQLLQLFDHAGPAVAALRQAELFANVGEQHHVGALPPTGKAGPPGAVASWADVHNFVQAVHRDDVAVFFNESKSHLLLFALNTLAFFNTSLSSRSMRFSLRSSATKRSRSDWTMGHSG